VAASAIFAVLPLLALFLLRSGYENGYRVLTLKDCVAATSQAEHDNAITYDFPMFSLPVSAATGTGQARPAQGLGTTASDSVLAKAVQVVRAGEPALVDVWSQPR
jgi:hypothetical protein